MLRSPYRPALALTLLLGGCTAFVAPRPPSVAQAHLGQLLLASSSIEDGRSVLGHARALLGEILASNEAVIRDARAGEPRRAKRHVFDMAETNEPRTASPERPGLQATLQRALYHVELAALADDAPETIRREAPRIRREAERLLEDAETLSSYVNFGFDVDSAESMLIVAEEIDTLARRMNGQFFVAGGYGLDELERDLEAMLIDADAPLADDDLWYLQNFERVGDGDDWRFGERPEAQRRNVFGGGSDRDGSSSSGGRGSDDDDGGSDDD